MKTNEKIGENDLPISHGFRWTPFGFYFCILCFRSKSVYHLNVPSALLRHYQIFLHNCHVDPIHLSRSCSPLTFFSLLTFSLRASILLFLSLSASFFRPWFLPVLSFLSVSFHIIHTWNIVNISWEVVKSLFNSHAETLPVGTSACVISLPWRQESGNSFHGNNT